MKHKIVATEITKEDKIAKVNAAVDIWYLVSFSKVNSRKRFCERPSSEIWMINTMVPVIETKNP
ncbi:MAG: hypothetical protein EBZ49_14445 [Proteobacteria bacterium]|nr:hypothetical protein [Pseudomonadota bacterium]